MRVEGKRGIVTFIAGTIIGLAIGLFLSMTIQTGEIMFIGIGLMMAVVAILFLFLRKKKGPENLIPISPSIAYQVLQMSIERVRKG